MAALYYFGDLQYWKIPGVAVEANQQVGCGVP
jgi:hypothetical protein